MHCGISATDKSIQTGSHLSSKEFNAAEVGGMQKTPPAVWQLAELRTGPKINCLPFVLASAPSNDASSEGAESKERKQR